MELLQLRYFYESAQNESFSKTAEKYMIPVSSVSASVRRLENELRCKLFDRSSNRIILNRNGIRLQQSLYLIFNELDKTIEELSAPDSDNREIKMLIRSMRSSITDYIIRYNKKYPHVAFKTVFDFGETNLENFDIIIDEKSHIYPEFENFELFNMRIRMKVASNYPILGRSLSLKQLYNQPFISLSENSNMHKMLINSCKRAGFTPNIVAQINDIECYEKMIESGIGIGLGKEIPQSSTSGNTAYLDISDFCERYVVCAYFKKHDNYGNIKHFLSFLKNQTLSSNVV